MYNRVRLPLLFLLLLGSSNLLSNQTLFGQTVIDWLPHNQGLEGGSIHMIWHSPSGAFFAGGYRSGLFRSKGFGATWQPTQFQKQYVYKMTADPSGYIYLWSQMGLFESSDDGLTWASSTLPIVPVHIEFSRDGIAYAQTAEGIYLRETSQAEWTLLKQWKANDLYPDSGEDIEPIGALRIQPDGTLVAGVGNHIFLSKNGIEWDCLSVEESGECLAGFFSWGNGDIDPARITDIVALEEDLLIYTESRYASGPGYYDGSSKTMANGYNLGCGIQQFFDTPFAYFVYAESCCTQGGCSGHGLYRIDKSPELSEASLIDNSSYAYEVADDGSWICAGSNQGIRCSFDGGNSWNIWNEGLENFSVSTLYVMKSGELLAGTGTGMRFDPASSTNQWSPLFINMRSRPSYRTLSCLTAPHTFVEHSNDSLYAVTGGAVYNTANPNDLWNITQAAFNCFGSFSAPLYDEKPLQPSLPACGYDTPGIFRSNSCAPLTREVALSVGTTLYYLYRNEVYRSDDGFVAHLIPITPPIQRYSYTVFAAHRNGSLVVGNGNTIYISKDQGGSWIKRVVRDGDLNILDITVLADSVVILGTDKGIYRSDNNGITWDVPLDVDACFNVITSNKKGIVVAGDQFISRDMGQTWENIATPLPAVVSTLALDDNGFLYAGTIGRGIFKSNHPIYTSADGPGLHQETLPATIYPNPASDRTHLEIHLETAEQVRIELFDLLGRQLEPLFDAPLARGTHRIDLRILGNESSGIYVVRITAGRLITSIPFTLL